MTRAEDLLNIWAWASLIGGPVLILLGARAAGVGVLAALAGSLVGLFGTPEFDQLPHGVAIGATTGLVVGGLIGLCRRSPAKRTTLVVMGGTIAVLGVGIVIGTHIRDEQMCFYPRGKGGGYGSCLAMDWDWLVQILVAFSAAFAAFLCLVQPTRRQRDDWAEVASVGTGDSAIRATSNGA